jgi:hypothetical protein
VIETIFGKSSNTSPGKTRRLILIARRPYLGIRNAKNAKFRSRLATRYPYRIHYFVEDADVWIVHIRHSARRPLDEPI